MIEIYKELFDLTGDPGLSRAGAAIAAVESAWWTYDPAIQANNPFGIKPAHNQTHLEGHPHLREFESIRQACRSWVYLVKESTNHTESRGLLPPTGELAAGAWMGWAKVFLSSYCERDPEYPGKFGQCFISRRLDKIVTEADIG